MTRASLPSTVVRTKDGAVPHNIYMQIQYKIRDYDRLRQMRRDLLSVPAAAPDGMPKSGAAGDPTGVRAVRLAQLDAQIDAIEASADEVARRCAPRVGPEFSPLEAYHSYDYFCDMFFPERGSAPSRRTWNYYKTDLSRRIAEKLYLI